MWCQPVDILDWQTQTHQPTRSTRLAEHFFVNMVLQRLFGKSKPKQQAPIGLPVADIQLSLREALAGCHGVRADRLLYKIDMAKTPADLWALRGDLHQCVAQIHTEGVAAYRINGLSAVFAGWIPAAQLTKIHPDFKPSNK
jgi:hypothetical protein